MYPARPVRRVFGTSGQELETKNSFFPLTTHYSLLTS